MKKRKLKILIVDDDKFVMSLLVEQLMYAGYSNVDFVETGKESIPIAGNYDLILLDYYLKNENGLDVLKEIKSIHPEKHVIMLSSQEYVSVAIKSIKLGALDYMEKSKLNYSVLIDVFKKIELIGIKKIFNTPERLKLMFSGTAMF